MPELLLSPLIEVVPDGPPQPRQCGRCRLIFPGDPDLFPGAIPDWWVCTACRPMLLPGTRISATSPR